MFSSLSLSLTYSTASQISPLRYLKLNKSKSVLLSSPKPALPPVPYVIEKYHHLLTQLLKPESRILCFFPLYNSTSFYSHSNNLLSPINLLLNISKTHLFLSPTDTIPVGPLLSLAQTIAMVSTKWFLCLQLRLNKQDIRARKSYILSTGVSTTHWLDGKRKHFKPLKKLSTKLPWVYINSFIK